jgi:hypothetical protein
MSAEAAFILIIFICVIFATVYDDDSDDWGW